jgi:hypothetical protein
MTSDIDEEFGHFRHRESPYDYEHFEKLRNIC